MTLARRGNLAGIALMIAAMAAAATTDAVAKALSGAMVGAHIILAIGVMGTAVFATATVLRGDRLLSPLIFHRVIVLRNLGEILGSGSIVLALTLVPLTQVTVIVQTAPLLVTLGAVFVLKERASWRDWGLLMMGFLGVLIIVRPTGAAFTPILLLPLLSAFGQALRDLASRAAPAEVTIWQMATWGFAAFALAGAVLSLVVGAPAPVLSGSDIVLLLALVPLAGAVMTLVINAMQSGDVAVVAPFRYSRLVFGIVLGIVFFGERLDGPTLLGALLIAGAGLLALRAHAGTR